MGEGGFGVVYRAWDPILKRAVALKLAHEGRARTRDDLIIAEARRMARVRHPNILAVHGADSDAGRAGIWCDLIEGGNLQQRVDQDGPLNRAEVLPLARRLADALNVIHERGLVHGDVKPANVMIRDNGRPVLMDFGAASEPAAPGTAVGSPIVMAPELFDDQPASAASDMYALGVLLFFALTGRYPVTADSLGELSDKHRAETSVDFGTLPRSLRSLIERCLAQQPASRPSAESLLVELRKVAEAPARHRRRLALAVVFVALAGAATTSFLASRAEAESHRRTELVKNVLVEAMSSALPDQQTGPASVKIVFEKLYELSNDELADYPVGRADVQLVAGRGLHQFGETERGLQITEQAVELLERSAPEANWDLAVGYLKLATVRAATDDFDGAEAAARRSLELLEPLDGEVVARHRLIAYNRLYVTLDKRGLWHEALKAQLDLLAQRKALHGEDSVRTAVDHHNLASTLASIGDHQAAMLHQQRAMDLLIADGDTQSIRMAYVVAAMANSQLNAGRFEEASQSLEQAERLYINTVGQDHNLTRRLDLFRARILLLTDQPQATADLLRTYIVSEPGENTDLFSAERDLGDALIALEEWEEAAEIFARLASDVQPFYQPITPTLEATAAYTAYRAGLLEHPPLQQLQMAHKAVVTAGYEQTKGVDHLERWIEQLKAMNASDATR